MSIAHNPVFHLSFDLFCKAEILILIDSLFKPEEQLLLGVD